MKIITVMMMMMMMMMMAMMMTMMMMMLMMMMAMMMAMMMVITMTMTMMMLMMLMVVVIVVVVRIVTAATVTRTMSMYSYVYICDMTRTHEYAVTRDTQPVWSLRKPSRQQRHHIASPYVITSSADSVGDGVRPGVVSVNEQLSTEWTEHINICELFNRGCIDHTQVRVI
jgi:hypothetical protein